MNCSYPMRSVWIILIFLGGTVYSQQLITGKVIDASKKPVPFAHILINLSNRGTVTNGEGEFQLYLRPTDHELLITSIGYKSKRLSLDGSKTRYEIELTEDLVLLGEVVITPKDYAQELIKSAIKNIHKNYSQSTELISGFLRERFSKDSLGREYYHIVESQLEVLKESYKDEHRYGQVRLRQSVNVTESEIDSEMKIYGGGHLVHRLDFVIRRDGFLDTTRMKKYQYEIQDTLRYNGHEVVKVHYAKNDSSERGNVFIDLDHLAFIKIEYFQDSERAGNLFDSHKRIYIQVTTEYFQSNGLWRIGYINYETKFFYKSPFFLNSIFSTHDFVPFTDEIPYHERLHFSQYLLEATKSADTSLWKAEPWPNQDQNKLQAKRGKRYLILEGWNTVWNYTTHLIGSTLTQFRCKIAT